MMESASTSKDAVLKVASKRKRKRHTSESNHAKAHGAKHSYRPPHKKARAIVSTTAAANNVMKFRLGGSVSDPLNLEDDHVMSHDPEPCGQPSPLPPALAKDPLNLDGKVKRFHGAKRDGESGRVGRHRKPRRRTTSKSHDQSHDQSHASANDEAKRKSSEQQKKKKAAQFRYGNYNRYYGYRNQGANEQDPRLSLFKREWFENKDCLDIGCNTGQVTITVAREFCPRRVVGVDIDGKLVATARKNMHRSSQPLVAPDGRQYPVSLTMARTTSLGFTLSSSGSSSTATCVFPNNIEFEHVNYVPETDADLDAQAPEYDVILALSLTKWIHLNWGDDGIKRFFKRVFRNLKPGGRFILEPQPFSTYARKKNITPEIAATYRSISLLPEQFHALLMSHEVGFSEHEFLGVADNKSKGFQRPLHMYTKAAAGNTQLPCSSHTQLVAMPTSSHAHSVFEQPIQVQHPLSPEGLTPAISDSLLETGKSLPTNSDLDSHTE